jgi:hypothetical protein
MDVISTNADLVVSVPETQTVEAVVELLRYLGRPSEPLPEAVRGSWAWFLVLSGKRDIYYTVTRRTCSCPYSTYRPGNPCKHQRKYFPGPKKTQAEIEKESDEESTRRQAAWYSFENKLSCLQ